MNKMAIAELVAAVAARVSLVREVAYPSHRRVDCHSPRRAEELGKEEVESHASNVVPMVKNKTSHGHRREDQEFKGKKASVGLAMIRLSRSSGAESIRAA